MPLTRKQKAAEVDSIAEDLEAAPSLYLTNFQGLSVAETNDLRARLREEGISYKVLKNTLVRRAMEQVGGYDELVDHLHGPTAVAFSEEPAAPARVIKDFLDDVGTDRPELKVAYVDGDVYGGDQLSVLAALKSRKELLGDIVGLLQAPMMNIVKGLQDQGRTLAGVLEQAGEYQSGEASASEEE